MAILIASDMTLSTDAYKKTTNLITGRNQFLGKGRIQVVMLGSAIGQNLTFSIGGVPLCDDLPCPYTGTTGQMTSKDNIIIDQVVAGGTAEMYIRNTTVGALTADYAVYFTPM